MPKHISEKPGAFFACQANVGDLCTYSSCFSLQELRTLADQAGFGIKYCEPGTDEYKAHGCFTFYVTKKEEPQTLVAFWKYDRYPYFLYGTVTKFGTGSVAGFVETTQYGKGSYFKPFLIVPEEDATQLILNFKKLEAYKSELEATMKRELEAELKRMMPSEFYALLNRKG